jgi:hypothetical protein
MVGIRAEVLTLAITAGDSFSAFSRGKERHTNDQQGGDDRSKAPEW